MKKGIYKGYIFENKKVAKEIFLTTFVITGAIDDIPVEPGQFLHLLCKDFPGFHLRRPFTIFDYSSRNNMTTISILYEVVGKITHHLSRSLQSHSVNNKDEANLNSNQCVDILLPLGRPFKVIESKRIVFVAGGVGIAAFGLLKRKINSDLILLYGARSKESFIAIELFKSSFTEVKYSTDDGTFGKHGFVTSLLEEDLKKYGNESFYYICGPDLMMRTSFLLIKKYKCAGQFSLENKMGCGLGACKACSIRIKDKEKNTIRIITCCKDGPNFSIEEFPDNGWWE
ncbi:MAG: hypothetical protein ACK4NF_00840 [Planctomycetota bacterium]